MVGGELKTSVHEYAARYIALPQSAVHVKLSGPTTQRIIPTDAHSGRMSWWSYPVDILDSTLTPDVDGSLVANATLSFWRWSDLEPHFTSPHLSLSTTGHLSTTPTTLATPP